MAANRTCAVRLTARGRVQGVGFRFFVREKASLFDIKGWVRNHPDGSVRIHAEGQKELLDEFVAAVKEGPRFGHVSDLEMEKTEPTNDYTGFHIEQ